ncbi:hypothetical protein A2U01_0059465, partial [Trifolium medium]|nr:hypothetical protein [Trifolium medium]
WLGREFVSLQGILQLFESFLGLGVGRRVRLGLTLVWHAVVWAIWTSRNVYYWRVFFDREVDG